MGLINSNGRIETDLLYLRIDGVDLNGMQSTLTSWKEQRSCNDSK